MKTPNFRREFLNVIENKQPVKTELDPNRLYYPYLKTAELAKDTTYKIRIMPLHPTRNPHGYARVVRHKLLMTNGKTQYILCPSCYGGEDPFLPILQQASQKLKSDPELRNYLTQDPDVKQALTELANPWVSYVFPIAIWATCKEKKNAAGYTEFYDYVPSKDNILIRAFQINEVKTFKTLITFLEPKNENHDEEYVPFNDPNLGINLNFRIATGAKTSYELSPAGVPSPLRPELAEKLKLDENNCNVVEKELKKGERPLNEIMTLFMQSVAGQALSNAGVADYSTL